MLIWRILSRAQQNPQSAAKREPVRVRAAWDLVSQNPDELSMKAGEVLVRRLCVGSGAQSQAAAAHSPGQEAPPHVSVFSIFSPFLHSLFACTESVPPWPGAPGARRLAHGRAS